MMVLALALRGQENFRVPGEAGSYLVTDAKCRDPKALIEPPHRKMAHLVFEWVTYGVIGT